MSAEQQQPDAKTIVESDPSFVKWIAPGMWLDKTDAVHFCIPEIHRHLGLPDTPEDRLESGTMLMEIVKKLLPKAKVKRNRKYDLNLGLPTDKPESGN